MRLLYLLCLALFLMVPTAGNAATPDDASVRQMIAVGKQLFAYADSCSISDTRSQTLKQAMLSALAESTLPSAEKDSYRETFSGRFIKRKASAQKCVSIRAAFLESEVRLSDFIQKNKTEKSIDRDLFRIAQVKGSLMHQGAKCGFKKSLLRAYENKALSQIRDMAQTDDGAREAIKLFIEEGSTYKQSDFMPDKENCKQTLKRIGGSPEKQTSAPSKTQQAKTFRHKADLSLLRYLLYCLPILLALKKKSPFLRVVFVLTIPVVVLFELKILFIFGVFLWFIAFALSNVSDNIKMRYIAQIASTPEGADWLNKQREKNAAWLKGTELPPPYPPSIPTNTGKMPSSVDGSVENFSRQFCDRCGAPRTRGKKKCPDCNYTYMDD